MDNREFYRDDENRLFLGVLSGASKYFNIDLKGLRLIFCIIGFFTMPLSIVSYFLVALFTKMK